MLPSCSMNRPPAQLSGGWQMRLRLAAALLDDATIVIFDEPTNALDVAGIATLQTLLVEHFATPERIVIVVSHNRAFLEAVATDTILMARSTLRQQAVGFAEFLAAARAREAHQNNRFARQQEQVERYRRTIANVQAQLR